MTALSINEHIVASHVRLIGDGESVGVIPLSEAIALARGDGLDLVQIAGGDPPVCRLLDADHFRFAREKQARIQARRQRDLAVDTKEIQLRPVTNSNDLAVKARRARSFLAGGDKVKLVVRFRGREKAHKDEGARIIDRFLADVGNHKVDRPVTTGESDMTMVLAPVVSKADLLRAQARDEPRTSPARV